MKTQSTGDENLLGAMAPDPCAGKEVSDISFDRICPPGARQMSALHRTLVEVAKRAAMPAGNERLAVTDSRCWFRDWQVLSHWHIDDRGSVFGIEQRRALVEVAQRAAEQMDGKRCFATQL
jgi:hypothetical protein